jgi:hypothetical protein
LARCSRFFVLPLLLVVMVSFWHFNDYELIPASRPNYPRLRGLR